MSFRTLNGMKAEDPNFRLECAASSEVRKHIQSTKLCRDLQLLQRGDVVRVRTDNKCRNPAQVEENVESRSHRILTVQGKELRRNRQHLRKTPKIFQQSHELEDKEL